MKDNITKKIYPKNIYERINRKNKLLGVKYNYDINKILTCHFIIAVFIFIIVILIKRDLIIASVITLIYFWGSEYLFYDLRLHKRTKLLEKEAVFYFQILALTLESGSNLKNALEITSQNIDSNLSLEFRKVIEDVNLGKSLNESLNDLKQRIPSDTVNNIILNLLESNIYGNNMIDSLNNQLDYLNDKILLETKAKINKMPVKISIVSVLIIVPLILIIILSPMLIRLINS
jgi:tight adherence protein C